MPSVSELARQEGPAPITDEELQAIRKSAAEFDVTHVQIGDLLAEVERLRNNASVFLQAIGEQPSVDPVYTLGVLAGGFKIEAERLRAVIAEKDAYIDRLHEGQEPLMPACDPPQPRTVSEEERRALMTDGTGDLIDLAREAGKRAARRAHGAGEGGA